MNLTIQLPDEEVPVLKARATARGVSAEQYALQVLEQDLAAAAEARPAQRRFDNLSEQFTFCWRQSRFGPIQRPAAHD